MVKQSFPDGGIIAFAYNERNGQTAITKQNGNKVIYEYDHSFRTSRIIYDDSEERFDYNTSNERISRVDCNGNKWNYEYDDNGNRISETDPMQAT